MILTFARAASPPDAGSQSPHAAGCSQWPDVSGACVQFHPLPTTRHNDTRGVPLFYFVKPPKTGTSSVETALKAAVPGYARFERCGRVRRNGHDPAAAVRHALREFCAAEPEWSEWGTFSTVRDPWSQAVSAWRWSSKCRLFKVRPSR